MTSSTAAAFDKQDTANEETNTSLQLESVQLTKPPRKRLPKILLIICLGIGILAASVFGYRWWQYASTHETTDDATVAGNLYAISSRILGTIADIKVNDNEQVEKGQLLVKLDSNPQQVQVIQAQAALLAAKRQAQAAQATINLASQTAAASNQTARGNISGAEAGIPAAEAAVKEAEAGIPAAQATVASAEASLQKAQADYNRNLTLFEQGAISRQQLDAAKAAYNVALAQKSAAIQGVSQAQAKLAQAKQGVTTAQSKLAASQGELQQATAQNQQTQVNRSQYDAAQAAIAQAQANLKDAQLQLSYTNITAPEKGKIGSKSVEVGDRVQSGTPLMSLVGNQYWVVANFKETQLKDIKPGESATVKLDALPNRTFVGSVQSLSPASGSEFALLPPDNATGNFTKVVQRIPVKITLDPQSIQGYESQITPGMSAVVSVEHQ